jgi:hypothetical protein
MGAPEEKEEREVSSSRKLSPSLAAALMLAAARCSAGTERTVCCVEGIFQPKMLSKEKLVEANL